MARSDYQIDNHQIDESNGKYTTNHDLATGPLQATTRDCFEETA